MKPRAGDFAVAALVVLAAAAIWLWPLLSTDQQQGRVAVVQVNGTEVLRIALEQASAEEKSFDVPGGVVQVRGGSVRMLQAECPDQVCVKTGWIDRVGQSVVCAPRRIVIAIEGERGTNDEMVPDAVAQ